MALGAGVRTRGSAGSHSHDWLTSETVNRSRMCRVRFSSKRGRGCTHGGEGRRGLRRGRKEREEGMVVHGSVMIYTRSISCPRPPSSPSTPWRLVRQCRCFPSLPCSPSARVRPLSNQKQIAGTPD